LGEETTAVEVGSMRAWMLAADAQKARESRLIRSVRLLPAFDQYVIGASRHAEQLLSGAPRASVYRPQGWISPVLLVNGFMQGTWRHEIKGSRIEVFIQPFKNGPAWIKRKASQEAERLAAFFGCKLSLKWKD